MNSNIDFEYLQEELLDELNNILEFGIFSFRFAANIGNKAFKSRLFFRNLRPSKLIAERSTDNYSFTELDYLKVSMR